MKTWSEKNGRADVTVYGFSWVDNLLACSAGLIVLGACIAVLAVMP
jgi:hypothetical protein